MDETWLYHYDPETKQRSMALAAHPAPKNFECKNHLENFRLYFLGSRQHPPHRLFFKGPNYQRGVLLISAGATEVHFGGKVPREVHQRGLDLAQYPGSQGTCKPEEIGLPGLPLS